MRMRVSLKVAKTLITYNVSSLVDLREVRSPSGKYRVLFSISSAPDVVCDFTTDYLSSKTSHRFMCSLISPLDVPTIVRSYTIALDGSVRSEPWNIRYDYKRSLECILAEGNLLVSAWRCYGNSRRLFVRMATYQGV